MRSLWRRMAARWLGGRASERLTCDSLIDALMLQVAVRNPTFLVVRRSEVSHHAIMTQPDQHHAARQKTIDEALAGTFGKPDR